MRYGTIIKYFPDKKFGFIRDSGLDVFFHVSALEEAETPPEIEVGQAVKFELMSRAEARQESGGASRDRSEQPKAKLVVLIDKIPGATLSEFDGSKRTRRHPRARQKKPTWRK